MLYFLFLSTAVMESTVKDVEKPVILIHCCCKSISFNDAKMIENRFRWRWDPEIAEGGSNSLMEPRLNTGGTGTVLS